jgi:glycosidase
MATAVLSPEVNQALQQLRDAAKRLEHKTVSVDGLPKQVRYPFPSPADWRDCWIYFLLIDRFNNPDAMPASTRDAPPTAWNQKYDFRQGGTFKGVQEQLGYIAALGAGAIWLSPVLKNSRPDEWRWNYHGYGVQDFLNVDERFASDGTRATAERELAELVDAAHARGLYVILDVVINHAGRVFDYVRNGAVVDQFSDRKTMDTPLGQEPPIRWLNGLGYPRPDWQDQLPSIGSLSADDAVWPTDLQRKEFFRRRGTKLSDTAPPGGFVRGDFESFRQLVPEFDGRAPGQEVLRAAYGANPVLSILVRVHQYLIAKYDVDGFRIDTVKYVAPEVAETFGNAIREFALSAGKANFFTFAEVYDNEFTIARFVGRNTPNAEGFGIDAALDFPLFYKLPPVAKGAAGVEEVREVFVERKRREAGLLSSHGEAGRFFVSFLDNHDQNARFNHALAPPSQVTLGLAALFCLQGIPCLYYGTEQGLQGTVNRQQTPSLDSNESVREALWGKQPVAFDTAHSLYTEVRKLARLRRDEPPLRYGRLYFREVSGNRRDFGLSSGTGGILAFSRILADREVLVVANTHPRQRFVGFVVVDLDLNQQPRKLEVVYSNFGRTGIDEVQLVPQALFYDGDRLRDVADTTALYVELEPMEIQILVPL